MSKYFKDKINKRLLIGVAFCVLGCAIFAATDQFIIDLQNIGTSTIYLVIARYQISLPVCVGIILLKYRRTFVQLIKDKKNLIRLLVYAVIVIIPQAWLYGQTMLYSDAPMTFIIDKVSVILIIAYVCFRKRRKPHKSEILGIILCFVGLTLILTQGFTQLSLKISGIALIYGTFLIFIQALAFILPENLQKTYPPLFVICLAISVCSVISLPFVQVWNPPIIFSTINFLEVGFIGIVGFLLGFYLFNSSISMLGSFKSSIISTIQLPITAVMSMLLGFCSISI